jgi:uncharacterized protein (TIGR02246 family)
MRYRSVLTVAFCIVFIASGGVADGKSGRSHSKTTSPSRAASQTSDPGLDKLAEDWKDAYNSNDAERLAQMYTEDAFYISPHVSGLIAEGRANIKSNFQRGMEGGGHVDKIRVLRTSASCTMAYSVCIYEATNNGQKVSGRNLLVLKKVRGRWLIASHVSVIPEK